ncbi:uncharacterized protein Z519_03960 [Cladophialophora bantiana CBS 173.52]|uniref:WD40 repeat-like protein n=1 Tax=Cladophialophora bantiana (strain ATCC 10958 / CBS 173.52 / CDC B-1940 / NIH 8579) TaxID=1442370 RepID=A0A0D2EZL1_CLAB1|nr:uncharacterized protein Z519_03960 [Cladophialophora bantiana CBS 173.52]KIW95376.1 hypothetical protein Z519_03960 [Cladophialophora bantiana CBS 173.52]
MEDSFSPVLQTEGDIVTDVAYSPNGAVAVAVSRDKCIYVWDIVSDQRVGYFNHDDTVYSVQFFSPPGLSLGLLSASFDGTIRFWAFEESNPTGLMFANIERPYRSCSQRNIQPSEWPDHFEQRGRQCLLLGCIDWQSRTGFGWS